jgi:hypothetical protein
MKDMHTRACLLTRSLLFHSLGDDGLDTGDDPKAALKWTMVGSQCGYVPFQEV